MNADNLGFWILNEVVIAVLLALVGFLFSWLLERSKSRLAFRNEIAKQRVVRIGEVWSALEKSEAAISKLLVEASKVIEQGSDSTALRKLKPLQNESMEKADRAKEIADANRFWLGEMFFERARTFNNAQMEMMDAFIGGDSRTVTQCDVRRNEARMSVVSFIDNPR